MFLEPARGLSLRNDDEIEKALFSQERRSLSDEIASAVGMSK